MKRQMQLGFSDGVRAQEAVAEAHEAAFAIVDGIQAKAAAIGLGIDAGTLSKKRTRADRNRLALDELVQLLVMGRREDAKAFVNVLLRLLRCKPAEDAPETDEEVFARFLESVSKDMSPERLEYHMRKARGE